eukprot:372193_1
MENNNDFISSLNSITSVSELRNQFISFHEEKETKIQQLKLKFMEISRGQKNAFVESENRRQAAISKGKKYKQSAQKLHEEIQIIRNENKQKDEQILELYSKLKQYDRDDIEEQTIMMLSSFTDTELNELKQTLQSDDDHTIHSPQHHSALTTFHNKSDSLMNWSNVCQCVKQQMWPKLSSAIKSIVDSLDGDNVFLFWDNVITNDSIDIVINKLKEKRHLQIEERKYLQKLIYRTKNFTPIVNNHYYQGFIQGKISSEMKTIYHSSKTLNEALLMDIFDVHRIFVFSNFNFRNYSATDFTKD